MASSQSFPTARISGDLKGPPKRYVVPGLAVFFAFLALGVVGTVRGASGPINPFIDPASALDASPIEPTCLSETCRELNEERRREDEGRAPAERAEQPGTAVADEEADAPPEAAPLVARPPTTSIVVAMTPPPTAAPPVATSSETRAAARVLTASLHGILQRLTDSGREPGRVMQVVDEARILLAAAERPLSALRVEARGNEALLAFTRSADQARAALVRAATSLHLAARRELDGRTDAPLGDPYAAGERLVGEARRRVEVVAEASAQLR